MNLKFHLIVSTVFLLLIIGVLFVFSIKEKPQEAVDANAPGGRFIQIAKATWGKNCNSQIEALHQSNAMAEDGVPLPEIVRDNNALRIVSSLCNGKDQCQFAVDPAVLGFNPMAKCRKAIEVEYRCFDIDRSKTVTSEDRGVVAINCLQDETP